MANRQGKTKSGNAGVTTHPLFPAIVALWFAALFGLGSLAIRPSLIEGLVLKSQLDTVIPAAAPPLGLTARILIALALAAVGGVLGGLLGRRIGRPKPQQTVRKRAAMGADSKTNDPMLRARDAHADAPARRPILAHEEIGEGISPIESPALSDASSNTLPGRRRALTSEDTGEGFAMPVVVPLPGPAPQVFDHATPTLPERANPVEPDRLDEEPQVFAPLDLEAFDLDGFAESAPDVVEASTPQQVFGEPQAVPLPVAAPLAAVPDTATAEPNGTLDSLDLVALTERFANALRDRRERVAAAPQPLPPAPEEQTPLVLPRLAGATREPVETPRAVPPAMPAAMRPLVLDDDETDDDDDFSSFLPLRRIPMAKPEPEPEEPVESGESSSIAAEFAPLPERFSPLSAVSEPDTAEYPSLLSVSAPSAPRQLFGRIEEPEADHSAIDPVVVFPGQATPLAAQLPVSFVENTAPLQRFDAPGNALSGHAVAPSQATAALDDPAETERSLRAALASLQRISGAA